LPVDAGPPDPIFTHYFFLNIFDIFFSKSTSFYFHLYLLLSFHINTFPKAIFFSEIKNYHDCTYDCKVDCNHDCKIWHEKKFDLNMLQYLTLRLRNVDE